MALTRLVRGTLAVPLLAGVLLLGTSGCAPPDPLDGTAWVLSGTPSEVERPGGITITLTFADGLAGGSGGVNSYGAPYETGANSRLTIGTITSTLMAGSEAANAAEASYFAALAEVAGYRIHNATLTLSDGDGEALFVFKRDTAGEQNLRQSARRPLVERPPRRPSFVC